MHTSQMNSMFNVTNPLYSYRVPSIPHHHDYRSYHMDPNSVPVQNMPIPVKPQMPQLPKPQNEGGLPTTSQPAPRRGRKSTVPPEQREQIRRLKKQNMERRRRACISDKMNALHSMAMTVVGIDPVNQQKVEKADILGICYTVLEGIAKIADERPDLRSQLHGLRSYLQDHTNQPVAMRCTDEHSQSSVGSDEVERESDDRLIIDTMYEDKENRIPRFTPPLVQPPGLSDTPQRLTTDCVRPVGRDLSNWHSTPSNRTSSLQNQSQDSGYRSSIDKSNLVSKFDQIRSPSTGKVDENGSLSANDARVHFGERSAFHAVKSDSRTRSSTSSPSVWRPYLDD